MPMPRPAPVLLLLPLLAGCLSGGDGDGGEGVELEAAALACLGGVCNFEATVDPEERQGNEVTIAVDPTNPLNIIASAKDYTPEYAGDCVWDGLYVTHDGGRTWANSNVPGSNWKRLADAQAGSPDTSPPGDFSAFWCATDPVVAFGPDGTAYWAVMPYQCDRLSGSKTGRGVLPDGGLNDWFWTCSSMYVLASDDAGDTWPRVRQVAFGPRLEHDKMWLSVSDDNVALLCWDRDPSYQVASLAPDGTNPAQQLSPTAVMACSTSRDRGDTWSAVTDANPDWTGYFPWVDWDGNGTAWMAALDGANVLVSRSEDGLVWRAPVTVGQYQDPEPGGEYGWPVLRGSDFRTFALPSLAVDRTGGPWGGSIYVAWFDHSTGEGDVLLTYSRDGGATWSEPRRVHDDDPLGQADQFMPAVSVGPDGTVDVVFYDRRNDPANHLFDLYHTYSVDGGETFAPNLRVSEASSDEQYSHHQNGMVFLGDYIDLDSSWGQAHAVWVDTRHQQADVFVATIARPSANAL